MIIKRGKHIDSLMANQSVRLSAAMTLRAGVTSQIARLSCNSNSGITCPTGESKQSASKEHHLFRDKHQPLSSIGFLW